MHLVVERGSFPVHVEVTEVNRMRYVQPSRYNIPPQEACYPSGWEGRSTCDGLQALHKYPRLMGHQINEKTSASL